MNDLLRSFCIIGCFSLCFFSLLFLLFSTRNRFFSRDIKRNCEYAFVCVCVYGCGGHQPQAIVCMSYIYQHAIHYVLYIVVDDQIIYALKSVTKWSLLPKTRTILSNMQSDQVEREREIRVNEMEKMMYIFCNKINQSITNREMDQCVNRTIFAFTIFWLYAFTRVEQRI